MFSDYNAIRQVSSKRKIMEMSSKTWKVNNTHIHNPRVKEENSREMNSMKT